MSHDTFAVFFSFAEKVRDPGLSGFIPKELLCLAEDQGGFPGNQKHRL